MVAEVANTVTPVQCAVLRPSLVSDLAASLLRREKTMNIQTELATVSARNHGLSSIELEGDSLSCNITYLSCSRNTDMSVSVVLCLISVQTDRSG